jgi:hypothetical protein
VRTITLGSRGTPLERDLSLVLRIAGVLAVRIRVGRMAARKPMVPAISMLTIGKVDVAMVGRILRIEQIYLLMGSWWGLRK